MLNIMSQREYFLINVFQDSNFVNFYRTIENDFQSGQQKQQMKMKSSSRFRKNRNTIHLFSQEGAKFQSQTHNPKPEKINKIQFGQIRHHIADLLHHNLKGLNIQAETRQRIVYVQRLKQNFQQKPSNWEKIKKTTVCLNREQDKENEQTDDFVKQSSDIQEISDQLSSSKNELIEQKSKKLIASWTALQTLDSSLRMKFQQLTEENQRLSQKIESLQSEFLHLEDEESFTQQQLKAEIRRRISDTQQRNKKHKAKLEKFKLREVVIQKKLLALSEREKEMNSRMEGALEKLFSECMSKFGMAFDQRAQDALKAKFLEKRIKHQNSEGC